MDKDNNEGWTPDWDSTYMIPSDMVDACRLRGILSMVWDGNHGVWQSGMMSSTLYAQQMRKAMEATLAWFDKKGGHNVRTKKAVLKDAKKAAAERVTQLYEGQLQMCEGQLVEVRGLERASASHVEVLAYEHMGNVTRSSSEWQLSATSQVQKVRRVELQAVDWKIELKTQRVTVFIAK